MAWDHGQIAGSPPPDTGYPAPGSLSAGDLADASPSEMPAVQLRHFFDMFEADQVFLNDPALALPLPACPKAGGPLEKGLGKTAELQQVFSVRLYGTITHLAQRQRMQSVIMIATLQRVSPSSVVVEACRPGDETAAATQSCRRTLLRGYAAQVFVDFVEGSTEPLRLRRRNL